MAMQFLFVPCRNLHNMHINPDLIRHHHDNNTRFVNIQYKQKIIIFLEFCPTTDFSTIAGYVNKFKSERIQQEMPTTLLINTNYVDLISMEPSELKILSKFIMEFNYNLLYATSVHLNLTEPMITEDHIKNRIK